jgi:hypothetical protein
MEVHTTPEQRAAIENKDRLLRSMELVPTQVYWGLSLGSVLLSAVLFFTGRWKAGLFVGQWPPTFLGLALLYKLLRPSRELGFTDTNRALGQVAEVTR